MSTYLILSIVVGLVALGVAVMLSNAISAANAGTARMKEIAGYIHEGAMAFLYREYKYLAIFIVVVAAIIATFLSVSTALCFIGGQGIGRSDRKRRCRRTQCQRSVQIRIRLCPPRGRQQSGPQVNGGVD